jgi:hypothetical protein
MMEIRAITKMNMAAWNGWVNKNLCCPFRFSLVRTPISWSELLLERNEGQGYGAWRLGVFAIADLTGKK